MCQTSSGLGLAQQAQQQELWALWLGEWLSLRTLTLTVTIQDDLSGGHEGLLVWVLPSAGTKLSAGLSPYLSSDIVQAVEQTSASTWTVCTHEHSTRASGKTARFC